MSEEFQNAWHHIRGISGQEELERAAAKARERYGDILDLPRPVSKKHPLLSVEQRAAQYSPFAALTGFGDAIDEAERLNDEMYEKK